MNKIAASGAVSLFCILAVGLSGCSSSVEGFNDVFGGNNGPQGRPSETVNATYKSDCQSQSWGSYRLQVNEMADSKMQVSQTTYTGTSDCTGYEPLEGNIDMSDITVVKAGDKVTVRGDSLSIEAKAVDARVFTDTVGLYVRYDGTVEEAGVKKPASSFSQIIGRSPYSGNYPYIWNWVDGREINPRSNPQVSSGSRSHASYNSVMSSCAKVEDIVVKAGKFRTCLTEYPGEKIWWGNVPIDGVIKYEKQEGVTSKFYLFDDVAQYNGLTDQAAINLELTSFGN